MPVEFSGNADGTVALAVCVGTLTQADMVASLRFAFDTHKLEPGRDRIVTVAADAVLHELDPAALQGIQRQVLEQERRRDGTVNFRSVLVYSSTMQKHLMELYKAIWDALDLPGVEFFVVASEAEAWDILGSPR